jgi:hypothetical protein
MIVREQIRESRGSAPKRMPNQWEERFRKFVKLLASALPIIGLTGMGGIVAAWTTLAIKATSLNEREEKPVFL